MLVTTREGSGPAKVAFDNLVVTTSSGGSPTTVLREDFNVSSAFRQFRHETETKCAQGEYVIRILKDGGGIYYPYDLMPVSDFALEVDQRILGGPEEIRGGLLYRYVDGANRYQVELNNRSEYRILKFVDGEEQSVDGLNWTRSSAIKLGASNHIKLVAQGSQFTLYVNDQLLSTVQDPTFDAGTIGLSGWGARGGNATVTFDNLRLYLPGTAQAALPTRTTVPASPTSLVAIHLRHLFPPFPVGSHQAYM